jgi:hypothetical protein
VLRVQEIRAEFDTLPDNLADLDVLITENETRVRSLHDANPLVLRQYEEREREIAEIRARLEDETKRLNTQVRVCALAPSGTTRWRCANRPTPSHHCVRHGVRDARSSPNRCDV